MGKRISFLFLSGLIVILMANCNVIADSSDSTESSSSSSNTGIITNYFGIMNVTNNLGTNVISVTTDSTTNNLGIISNFIITNGYIMYMWQNITNMMTSFTGVITNSVTNEYYYTNNLCITNGPVITTAIIGWWYLFSVETETETNTNYYMPGFGYAEVFNFNSTTNYDKWLLTNVNAYSYKNFNYSISNNNNIINLNISDTYLNMPLAGSSGGNISNQWSTIQMRTNTVLNSFYSNNYIIVTNIYCEIYIYTYTNNVTNYSFVTNYGPTNFLGIINTNVFRHIILNSISNLNLATE